MEHLRKVLLLASVAILISTQALPQSSLSYQQAISTAIHFYNEVHREENAFRLLQIYSPSPNQNSFQCLLGNKPVLCSRTQAFGLMDDSYGSKGPHEQTLKRLNFTLKETVCPMTEELLLDQCDFKTEGLMKECQGSISNEQDIAAIILTCDPVTPGSFRSKRSPLPGRKKSSRRNSYRTGGYSVISLGKPSRHKAPNRKPVWV